MANHQLAKGDTVVFNTLLENLPDGHKLYVRYKGHLEDEISFRLIPDKGAFDLVIDSAKKGLFHTLEWYGVPNGINDLSDDKL